jgi:predicted metalloprotease
MSAKNARDTRLTLAGEPRVQLLPPIVQEREKARASRRMLVGLVILSLVVVAGGYAFALFRAGTAEQSLADAHAQTQAILKEQATYAEGTRVATEVAQTQEAQRVVTSLEVLWGPIIDQVRRTLPTGRLSTRSS